jgi:hypothetical protein
VLFPNVILSYKKASATPTGATSVPGDWDWAVHRPAKETWSTKKEIAGHPLHSSLVPFPPPFFLVRFSYPWDFAYPFPFLALAGLPKLPRPCAKRLSSVEVRGTKEW